MLVRVILELLNEGHYHEEISDQAHEVLGEALAHLQKQEYHQLKAQGVHEGKNASTDQQIKICKVALPALEEAVAAYNTDDFTAVATQLNVALTTDGSPEKRKLARRTKVK